MAHAAGEDARPDRDAVNPSSFPSLDDHSEVVVAADGVLELARSFRLSDSSGQRGFLRAEITPAP